MTQHLPTMFQRVALPCALALLPWLAACSTDDANEGSKNPPPHADKAGADSAMMTMAAQTDAQVFVQKTLDSPLPPADHDEKGPLTPRPAQISTQSPVQNPHQSPLQGSSARLAIKSVSYHGQGCPANSAAVSISPDAEAFTLSLSQFSVVLEPHFLARTQIKTCYMDLNLWVPMGWQIAISHLDFRGYTDLPEQGAARLDIKVGGLNFNASIPAPYSDNFHARRSFELHALSWSICGQEARLAIEMSAILSVPADSGGMLHLDSIDGEVNPHFGISWRRCSVS